MGLVVGTAPSEQLDEVVLELASRMALIGRDLLIANKRVVNMGVELMGRSQLQKFAALNDAIGHRAPEAVAFSDRIGEIGCAQDRGPRARRRLRRTRTTGDVAP